MVDVVVQSTIPESDHAALARYSVLTACVYAESTALQARVASSFRVVKL